MRSAEDRRDDNLGISGEIRIEDALAIYETSAKGDDDIALFTSTCRMWLENSYWQGFSDALMPGLKAEMDEFFQRWKKEQDDKYGGPANPPAPTRWEGVP